MNIVWMIIIELISWNGALCVKKEVGIVEGEYNPKIPVIKKGGSGVQRGQYSGHAEVA